MSTKNVFVRVNGVDVSTIGFLNFIQGTGVTFTVSENFGTDYTNVTISASGGISSVTSLSIDKWTVG